jgi:hypothetical protein
MRNQKTTGPESGQTQSISYQQTFSAWAVPLAASRGLLPDQSEMRWISPIILCDARYFSDKVNLGFAWGWRTMSVLSDFESMRIYRQRALEFARLADASLLSDVRYRYQLIANHYAELANTVERSDKAKTTPRLEALRARREMISERRSVRAGRRSNAS